MFANHLIWSVAVAIAASPALAAQPAPPPEQTIQAPPTLEVRKSDPSVPRPDVIQNPDWEETPAGDRLAALFPAAGLRQHASGRVKMMCKAQRDGTLTDCSILEETPPSLGFGAATLASAPYFKLAPTTEDGRSVEGRMVIVPILWRPPVD